MWNKDLAENALYTCKTCVYAHDQCRNTETYDDVGQNIAMYSTKAIKPIDYKVVITGILDSWLRQAENVHMKLIESFRSDSGFETHFKTLIIYTHRIQISVTKSKISHK